MSNKLWEKRREAFREAIKRVRTDAKMTQSELAKKMRRYQSYVSKYESGERKLDYVEVVEILDACGTTIAKFDRIYKNQL